MSGKKFRLSGVLLSVICAVFTAEAVAPAAAIGNQQFFWWTFLIITFLLPYGLVVSELGTAYSDDEGGLYDWVRRAFGDSAAARCAWCYWVNFPVWMASLAVLFPSNIEALLGTELSIPVKLAIELAVVWGGTLICMSRASEASWIMNAAAVLKLVIALTLGGLGIWQAINTGFANNMDPATFLPSMDASALSYLSVILFNFMGFEVVATYAGDMEDPKRQIPIAIIVGGAVIAAIYLLSSFGISAAVPSDELALDSGIADAVSIMAGAGSPLHAAVSIGFLLTLVGNVISWSFGVNDVTAAAAEDGNMPHVFASRFKNGMPKGALFLNAILETILLCLAPVMDALGLADIFWALFSVGVVFLLLGYVPMFPAFLRLRHDDPDRERPFKAPGGKNLTFLFAWVPVVLLILAVVVTVVPLNGSEAELQKLPMLGMAVFLALLGEMLHALSRHHRGGERYYGYRVSGEPRKRG